VEAGEQEHHFFGLAERRRKKRRQDLWDLAFILFNSAGEPFGLVRLVETFQVNSAILFGRLIHLITRHGKTPFIWMAFRMSGINILKNSESMIVLTLRLNHTE
jgi:hypothetical protein